MLKNKKIKYLIALWFFSIALKAQVNLVQNPSFESYFSCPIGPDEMYKAINWNSYANSPDYFNSCGTMSVPVNWGGYQQASTGQAYAAFATRGDKTIGGNNLREFIGGPLSASLAVGTKYFVSIKISLTVESSISANCATNKMGVKFSKVPFSNLNPALVNNNAKVYSNTIITDTINWTKLFGSFIADSLYSHVIIGNFFDDNNTDTLIMDNNSHCEGAYYYVDDICVSTDSLFTLNYQPTSINSKEKDHEHYSIGPNPAIDFFSIYNKVSNSKYDFEIYDFLGKKILQKNNLSDSEYKILVTNFSSGLYLVKIKVNKSELTFKLIKK